MHLPSLKQLQYLLAVVELRHFGQAAERCFVTQSTLSAGISELESLLGVQLLERTKRKVSPTPLGLDLADKARLILQQAAELVETAQTAHLPLNGVVRLGVIPTVGPFLLPRVLPPIRLRFTGLQLYLIEEQTAQLLERLDSGELDCAVLALPYELRRMEYQLFMQENFWVAFPVGHPLSHGGPISSVELPVDELLLLEEGHCMRDHILSACHRPGLQRSAAFQGTSLYTLLEMVAGGQGITLLPAMAISSGLVNHERIRLRALAEAGPHRELGLVWRATYHRQQEMHLLAETLQQLV
ncbi:MAG: LysR family transcriptional regulator hydrogen peroxide-inducible protein activator [Halothiobacillaceae bacterium]|nr:MAG: LysR family transcriptional regulator hydrogen peroxide-inducible protein activator [Halothiobacillaceae bacterium]